MSFNAKEWINIDHNEDKTIVDFILKLHDVFKKCRRSNVNPWQLMLPSSFALG